MLLFQLFLFSPFIMQAQNQVQRQVDSLKFVTEIPYICHYRFSDEINGPDINPFALGCGDKLLWKVVMLKEKAISCLIEELDNMEETPASFPLQGGQCKVADVAYIALQEIIHGIPTAELLNVNPDNYDCGYCYYHYNLNKKNQRKKFKKAVAEWYNHNKDKLVWVNKEGFSTCDCSGPHPNGGYYIIESK